MSSIKKKQLIDKKCTHCYEPTHIKFNFSFISYMDDFTDFHKAKLVDRLIEISKEPYLVVAKWRKNIGFENIKVHISKEIDSRFYDGNNRDFDGKYTIIRLYPNDNPCNSRIIGKMIHNVFYIFFIDIKGNLYSH